MVISTIECYIYSIKTGEALKIIKNYPNINIKISFQYSNIRKYVGYIYTEWNIFLLVVTNFYERNIKQSKWNGEHVKKFNLVDDVCLLLNFCLH